MCANRDKNLTFDEIKYSTIHLDIICLTIELVILSILIIYYVFYNFGKALFNIFTYSAIEPVSTERKNE
jgi:hypothetical protein